MIRKVLVVVAFLSFCLINPYRSMADDNGMQISLLTSSPYEGEVFTVYGHAALRVKDNTYKFDVVFNYGIFSFDQPNFIYRFAKGETDYMLGACNYSDYIIEYQMRGSTVTEQILDLSSEEISNIWKALQLNYEPQNRQYRYNFFFDNCATRPVSLIENNVFGKVLYRWSPEKRSFRDMINECSRNHPWLTLGCDLALGSPTDRIVTNHEMMFLPEYMKDAVAEAVIVGSDGTERPLVKQTIVIPSGPDEYGVETGLFSPMVCSMLLCIVIIAVTYYESIRKRYCAWVDILLFTAAGLGGCILFFLGFISEHPCTSPNWNMLWLHPLQLTVLPFSIVKKGRKAVFYYHFINFVAIMVLLVGWNFIPQHFNIAIIPLIIILCMRSLLYIVREYKKKKRLT